MARTAQRSTILAAVLMVGASACSEPQCPSYLHDEGTDCVVPGEKPAADAGSEIGSRTEAQSERGAGGASARGGATAKGVSATSAGGTGGARDAAAAGTRAEAGGGVGGLPMPSMTTKTAMAGMGGAGMAMSAMSSSTPTTPKCGNGVREGTELCDGADCPTECKGADPANTCVGAKIEGSASTCDAHCVPTEITACAAGDGCCPKGCNHGTDADCSPSCGDGVLTGPETCEPTSKDHPCPTLTDCDDRDVCTEDTITGNAQTCSARCAHALVSRPFLDCADADPCTDDTIIDSLTKCAYECPHARREPTAAPNNCVDDDPCTDDTPVLSKTSCGYECQHTRRQPAAAANNCIDSDPCTDDTPVISSERCEYTCPHNRRTLTAVDCVDANPCTDDTPVRSTTSCRYECPRPLLPAGTPCGGGQLCSVDGQCRAVKKYYESCSADADCPPADGICRNGTCTRACPSATMKVDPNCPTSPRGFPVWCTAHDRGNWCEEVLL